MLPGTRRVDLSKQSPPPKPDPTLWQSFWQEAGLHGCTVAFPTAARKALEERWLGFFRQIDGTSVLDVATGRGAVLSYAAAVLPETLGVELTGVDLANRLSTNNRTRMLGGVDAASLPFSDCSFDHVTSQFGVEYAGFEAALAEAGRVCARTMLLLVHAAEGVVIRHNLLQATQADWLLNELHFPTNLAAHFAEPTEASSVKLDRLLQQIRERAQLDENISVLEAVYESALDLQDRANKEAPDAIQQAIALLADELSQHRDRMALLGRACVNRERVDAAAAKLKSLSFASATVFEERPGHDRQLVGYWLEAARGTKHEAGELA